MLSHWVSQRWDNINNYYKAYTKNMETRVWQWWHQLMTPLCDIFWETIQQSFVHVTRNHPVLHPQTLLAKLPTQQTCEYSVAIEVGETPRNMYTTPVYSVPSSLCPVSSGAAMATSITISHKCLFSLQSLLSYLGNRPCPNHRCSQQICQSDLSDLCWEPGSLMWYSLSCHWCCHSNKPSLVLHCTVDTQLQGCHSYRDVNTSIKRIWNCYSITNFVPI